MGLGQRIQAMSVTHPFSINKKLDQFLSERLPDLMDEYKIADRSDLMDMEKEFGDLEKRMEDLEVWKKGFGDRLANDQGRMERLKLKFNVK